MNLLRDFFKGIFGERVQKIPVDAGFSCPNRDGTLSRMGCTYCSNEAFSPFYCDPHKPVEKQIAEGMTFFGKKYKTKLFIAYFQAFSGTHACVDDLFRIFSAALNFPEMAGIIVATRPDCLDREKLKMLAEFALTRFVGLELGIESCKDSVLTRVNRGHSFERTAQAIFMAREYGLHVGGHLIFGLPGENRGDHLEAAQVLSRLPLHSLKIHNLQILKGTPMALEYSSRPKDFPSYSLEQYISLLADFIERLHPRILIDRLSAQSPPEMLVNESWGRLKNEKILALLVKYMEKRKTWQGRFA